MTCAFCTFTRAKNEATMWNAFVVAISAVNELGGEISAFQIMPKLFYPMLLLFSSLITIMRGSDRTGA